MGRGGATTAVPPWRRESGRVWESGLDLGVGGSADLTKRDKPVKQHTREKEHEGTFSSWGREAPVFTELR